MKLDLENNYKHHSPINDDVVKRHELIRSKTRGLADAVWAYMPRLKGISFSTYPIRNSNDVG